MVTTNGYSQREAQLRKQLFLQWSFLSPTAVVLEEGMGGDAAEVARCIAAAIVFADRPCSPQSSETSIILEGGRLFECSVEWMVSVSHMHP